MKKFNQALSKERLYAIGNVVKEYSKVLGPVIGYVLYSNRGAIADVLEELRYSGNVNYNDAVKVIMNSNMLTSYKTDIMKILKKNESSEYYKTIINVVKSDVLSSYKVEMISEINKEK